VTAAPAIIRDPVAMAAWAEDCRRRGQRIAFVPTMGALHEGHLSLLREGRRRGDRLALSIFVNPTQFGPGEDLSRYPRDLDGDLGKAASAGTDVAYVPDAAAVYPPGYQTYIQVREAEQGLCGAHRPGHFIGVATVVCKLFHVVRPHLALFGEKDYQQLAVIRAMVRDLEMGIDIVGMPIVREPDGLAMSSRNQYLSPAERQRALSLSRGLGAAAAAARAGQTDAGGLVALAREALTGNVDSIDYVELRDAITLAPVERIEGPAVMLVAVFVGRTRLIDNVVLTIPPRG
jgi:pantoate--beta-alanine ligase